MISNNISNQIVSGPDSNGIVTEKFHRINKDGLREQVTRKYTSSDPHGCVFRLQRKHKIIKPFGPGSESKTFRFSATSVSSEEVFIEAPNAKKEDVVVILRKNMLKSKTKGLRNKTLATILAEPRQIKNSRYKHPNHNKIPCDFEDSVCTTQLRASNLTEDATESDLRELFSPFGRITRVFVAKDHVTRKSRGFGFVTFNTKKDAEVALEQLNGYGYGYLILKVEWAKPNKNKQTYYSGYGKALPQTEKK